MNFNPFSPITTQETQRGGLLGELPSFTTQTWNPSTGKFINKYQYGTAGLPSWDQASAQKQEFERRERLMGLSKSAIDIGRGASELGLSQINLSSERSRQRAKEAFATGNTFGLTPIERYYYDQLKGEQAIRSAEEMKAKFESQFYGGGGFSSWSTPTFPSMG